MATDYIKKINDLPLAASQAAPSSTLATTLNGKVGTVTTSGTGSVVTGVTKSGATVTVTKGDIAIDNLSDWAATTDVVLNDGTYHTWWPTAPTSSNQVYGVSISDGRLYRVYNNKGTYSVQAYDKTTTYQTLTQALVDTGTETTGKLITAKIVHDSIKKWSIETLTNPDFDNITTVGIYNIQVTQSCNGAPPGLGSMGSCIMIVNAVNDDVIMSQTVFMANGRTCSRGRSGDGTWDTYWANRESRGIAEAIDAHAEGDSTHATGNNAHSEGYQTRASGASSHAEGNKSEAQGGQAHAEGYNTVASGASSHSEGTNTIASNKQAHAEGFAGRAFGESSHAEGSWTVTGGVSAHAEGGATYAGGKDSHAEGYSNGYVSAELTAPVNANGSTFTFASGTSLGGHNYIAVPSIGFCSKIMSAAGPTYTTQGSVSQALPIGTLCLFISSGAVGYVSHSEGFKTFAYGSRSHAEGDSTQAIGDYSHAEGASTTASGTYSHAEGNGSTASSTYAHAEGYSTTAGGSQSHAEGYQTKATGDASHAEGIGTEAQSAGMHVAGQYNATKSGYARVTGWGSSTTAKDIERLDTQGNLWISGYLSGATVFMITPGTTTRAAIEAAYQANRPMMLDISGINGGNQVVYVPTEVRRVYSDNTGTNFDYYFKFTYPASFNAGYHAGTMEPNGLISSYYVAVTKDNGWVKMTDVSHNGWDLVSSSTAIDAIPYAKAVSAQTADAAYDCVVNSTLDTKIQNKINTDGSNAISNDDATGAMSTMLSGMMSGGSEITSDAVQIITTDSAGASNGKWYRRSIDKLWAWFKNKTRSNVTVEYGTRSWTATTYLSEIYIGASGTWTNMTPIDATALKVGDIARITITITDMANAHFIAEIKVTSVPTTSSGNINGTVVAAYQADPNEMLENSDGSADANNFIIPGTYNLKKVIQITKNWPGSGSGNTDYTPLLVQRCVSTNATGSDMYKTQYVAQEIFWTSRAMWRARGVDGTWSDWHQIGYTASYTAAGSNSAPVYVKATGEIAACSNITADRVIPSNGVFTVQSGNSGGTLVCDQLRLTGAGTGYGSHSIIMVSSNVVVSTSHISNMASGDIIIYMNTSNSVLTISWKRDADGHVASGNIQIGCSAMVFCRNATSGIFSRLD